MTNLETTVLLSVEDTIAALSTAQDVTYRPPAA